MTSLTHPTGTDNGRGIEPGESRTDSRDKAKAMRQRIDDTLEGLAKAVDDVRASDTFKAYLDTQARFHRYSWHNSLLNRHATTRRDASRRVPDVEKTRAIRSQRRARNHEFRAVFLP